MENSQSHTIDSSFIKAEAMRLGFSACGVADADVVDAHTRRIYEQYMAEGRMADMNYLANYPDLRFDPTQLLPGCHTIICVALSYYPGQPLPDDTYQIAYYAYGRDYHEVMRQKLAQLISTLADNDSDESAPAYNLSGRRINGNTKGLRIVNGKKVVIK